MILPKRPLLSLLALLALAGCKGAGGAQAGAGKQQQDAQQASQATNPPASDDGDDLDVSRATPMGVGNGTYLTSLRNAFPILANAGQPPDLGHGVPDAEFSSEQFALGLPLAGTWQMYGFSDHVAKTLDLYFGAQGYFKGRQVAARKDGKPRTFFYKGDGTAAFPATYFVVRPDDPGSPWQYVIDVYQETTPGAGTFESRLKVQFSVHDGQYAKVHLSWNLLRDSDTSRELAIIDYDTGGAADTYSLQLVHKVDPPTTANPQLQVYRETVQASHSIAFQGIDLYLLPQLTPRPGLPRYGWRVPGDMDYFSGAMMMDGGTTPTYVVSQNLSFVPAEQAGGTPAPYDSFFTSSLISSLRAQTPALPLGTACATVGDSLKAVAGANVPSNICATNTAVSDADTLAAVTSACESRPTIPSELGTLCSLNWGRHLIANPSRLSFTSSAPLTQVMLPGKALLAGHTASDQLLATLPALDLPVVEQIPWLQLVTKNAADFPGAEALPLQ